MLTGTIPPTVSNLSNLINLSLGINFLVGQVPSEIGALAMLRKSLDDGSDERQLFYICSFVNAFFVLPYPGNLDLRRNFLSGTLPQEVVGLVNLGKKSELHSSSKDVTCTLIVPCFLSFGFTEVAIRVSLIETQHVRVYFENKPRSDNASCASPCIISIFVLKCS